MTTLEALKVLEKHSDKPIKDKEMLQAYALSMDALLFKHHMEIAGAFEAKQPKHICECGNEHILEGEIY